MTSSGPHHIHTGHSDPARHLPRLNVDLDDIRDRHARMLDTTDTMQRWAARADLSFDISPLVNEVDRLYLLLCESRRRLADLQAAAQATLTAHAEGEPYPLAYLQDQLDHLTTIGLPDFPTPHPDEDDDRDRPPDGPDDGDDAAGSLGPGGGGR
jgi:hypothetical protein